MMNALRNGAKRMRKQRSLDVFQWPEWKAFAARIGVIERPIRKVVVTLDVDACALVEETFIGLDTCLTHPSDTRPLASETQENEETTPTPAPSVDTDASGTGSQTSS